MRLGLIARADKTGLGYQTRSYYKWLKPAETMLIDISELNGQEQYYGWYEDYHLVKGIPNRPQMQSFLQKIDVLLTAETPYNYEFYSLARRMNVRTVCVPNWEFFDYFLHDYPMPDLFISPTLWHFGELKVLAEAKGSEAIYLHHPIDRVEFPFRQRVSRKFFHVAGKPATMDRNGTIDALMACPELVVTTQSEPFAKKIRESFRRSNVYLNLATPQEVYQKGDILILPRKYGGNCLPLNEALSSGCPVIMTDISPNSDILPKEWLVPSTRTGSFEPRTVIDLFAADPDALRQKIAWFKECDIELESQKANEIAEAISWDNMKEKYMEVLSGAKDSGNSPSGTPGAN